MKTKQAEIQDIKKLMEILGSIFDQHEDRVLEIEEKSGITDRVYLKIP